MKYFLTIGFTETHQTKQQKQLWDKHMKHFQLLVLLKHTNDKLILLKA